jgi:hypothetical protein
LVEHRGGHETLDDGVHKACVSDIGNTLNNRLIAFLR